jgi:hypothetical protein
MHGVCFAEGGSDFTHRLAMRWVPWSNDETKRMCGRWKYKKVGMYLGLQSCSFARTDFYLADK